MAADVVGYSRLMGANEQATVDALDHCRAIFRKAIEANQGRVVDMAGDSVLAAFETAAGAVEAGLAAQQDVEARGAALPEDRRMRYRVGVHLGDVIEKADGSIYGDGVNIAARLEGIGAPGSVTVSDTVQSALRGRMDLDFHFLGDQEVKNIAHPVPAYRILLEGESAPEPAPPAKRRRLALAAAAIAGVLALAVVGWLALDRGGGSPADDLLALPTGPAIAVLPFDSLGQDETERVFAGGLAAEIATALSHFDLRVTAHGSASHYGGAELDRPEIAAALKVRYLLTGGVAISRERLRVQVQLFDTESDTLMWGETYESDLSVAHLFDVQDEITQSVVATIAGDLGEINKLIYTEAQRSVPGSTDAYACVLMFYDYGLTYTLEGSTAARSCLEATVESDPDYAVAWAALAELYADAAAYGWEPYDAYMEKGEEAARRAIALDPDSQRALWALGYVFHMTNRVDLFFDEAEIALRLNAYNPNLIGSIGGFIAWAGDWDRGGRLLDKAFALDPEHPPWQNYPYLQWQMRQGHWEEALSWAQKAETGMPDWYWSPVNVAAVLGHMGRLEEAAAVARVNALNPDFAANARAEYTYWVRDEVFTEFFLEGLRKAGMEIPEASD